MADLTKNFKTEYDAARVTIAKNGDYERSWQPLVRKLETLMGADGFNAGQEVALGQLRLKVKEGSSQTKITEDKGILQAVGAWTASDTGTIDDEAKKRAASLKLLRHIYLQNKAGNRKVWVLSLPDDFTDWPSRYLATNASTAGTVKRLLTSHNEHFSERQRRHIGNSTQHALAWCQKTGIVLANAAAVAGTGANPSRDNARTLVRRWFAETGLDDTTLNTHIATLTQGFKGIIAMLNKGHFLVTDWVPFRGTTDASELAWLNTLAFTFRSKGEGMDVVYIESAFFTAQYEVIRDKSADWTRIIVHELTHLVCGTTDVDNVRYAHYGIGPHAGYPGSKCITNADNWAFFAADCASAISDSERTRALSIK